MTGRKIQLLIIAGILLAWNGAEARTAIRQQKRERCETVQQGAYLRLEQSSHDFGDVSRRGGDLMHDFVMVNDGTSPLVITRVITSCSCLKASFSKRPVPPGSREVIRIIYEPHKSEAGIFHKVIQVYSNSVGGRQLITVQGNSVDLMKK